MPAPNAGPSATLFNHATGAYESVPAERVQEALASGQYADTGNVLTQADGGTLSRPATQLPQATTQGEGNALVEAAQLAAEQRLAARKEALSAPVATFAEGIVDALSVGLLSDRSDEGKLRREIDSGSALLGQLVGTVGGLAGGPVRAATLSGEAAGRAAAKKVVGEITDASGRGARILSRGLEEAAGNSLVMGATGFGHAINETLIHDKPFASEAAIDEAGLGAVMGFGAGGLWGAFAKAGRKATRAAVEASGVAKSESESVLDILGSARSQWDTAVETHAQRLGVLEQLAKEGHIPDDFVLGRQAALRNVRRAKSQLDQFDAEKALDGNAKDYSKFRKAVDDYDDAVRVLDDAMTPQRAEQLPIDAGAGGNWTVGQDDLWRLELQTPVGKEGAAPGSVPGSAPGSAPIQPIQPSSGVENLGGSVTPTSELGTNVGKRSATPSPQVQLPAVDKAAIGSAPTELASGSAPGFPPAQVADNVKAPAPTSVQQYINDWFAQAQSAPNQIRSTPGDVAEARIRQSLKELESASGGRLDMAGALELGKNLGIGEARNPLGATLDQVWSLKKAGQFAADEARGVKTPLRKSVSSYVASYAGRTAGRGIGSAVMGHAVGGPVGAILGYAVAQGGFAGGVMAKAGQIAELVATTGEALLRGRRGTLLAQAAGRNQSYAYDEQGPIRNPVDRIQTIQRLAADPERLRAVVKTRLGDLNLTAPEFAQAVEDQTVRQMTNLSLKAPAIVWTALGQPIQPGRTELQNFFEFENATHNLPGLLRTIASGAASTAQVDALRLQFPSVHAKLVGELLGDTSRLSRLPPAQLKNLERITGLSLTYSTMYPDSIGRTQQGYATSMEQAEPTNKPQAFKLPEVRPLPSQATGGRAPGNEPR